MKFLLQNFIFILLNLLYTKLALFYDWVSYLVSFGRWQDWIFITLPYIESGPTLEIGFGPGHLLATFAEKKFDIYGVDSSYQMCQLAKSRTDSLGFKLSIVNGYAQSLPFDTGIFHNCIATFPTAAIYNLYSLTEIYRVLSINSKLILIPFAFIGDKSIFDRIAAWVFKFTKQAPHQEHIDVWTSKFLTLISEAGFKIDFNLIELDTSKVGIVIAEKL